jgi:nitrogen fixation NifU-like protein
VTREALYHDALVRLARAAAEPARLDGADGSARRDNPLCGDEVTIDVRLRAGRIDAVGHRVRGCALCQAATALLSRAAPGREPPEIGEARAGLAAMLRGDRPFAPEGAWEGLSVFVPVAGVPSRHECVLLPFDALGDALAGARG